MLFIMQLNQDTDIKNNNMKTIELKHTSQFIKILTIITLTYLIFSLSNNQMIIHRTAPFQYPSADTLVTSN
jgi:hypothetical protein